MAKKSNHPWDRAAATRLTRFSTIKGDMEPVDSGVNFFILALEALGAKTRFSCEGHPTGFYVLFEAPYELAREIKAAGYFSVQIEGDNLWSIRKETTEYMHDAMGFGPYTERSKRQTLRWAAEAWLREFEGRLDALGPAQDKTAAVAA